MKSVSKNELKKIRSRIRLVAKENHTTIEGEDSFISAYNKGWNDLLKTLELYGLKFEKIIRNEKK